MRAEHHLNPDELLSLPVEAGSVIDIEDGVVWITTEGEDVILRGGQNHRIGRHGEALVQALAAARLHLQPPQQGESAWRRLLQLIGA
ncbi:MAG: DUF2917 domain-containing protein [Burkholderiales bacterium]|nr:DUF2917 domain-containing protein [Burkholderiales bacterium]